MKALDVEELFDAREREAPCSLSFLSLTPPQKKKRTKTLQSPRGRTRASSPGTARRAAAGLERAETAAGAPPPAAATAAA